MAAPVKSAETPFTGRIFMIFPPTVLMIFQPPIDVPRPMAVAQANCTQVGISLAEVCKFAVMRAIVIIPIAFCASFVPCVYDCRAAVTICTLRNCLFVFAKLLSLKISLTML